MKLCFTTNNGLQCLVAVGKNDDKAKRIDDILRFVTHY